MTARRFALMAVALLSAAALLVHDLRYRLVFGDDTGSVLAEHGHGYLAALSPFVAVLCAIACARLLLGVARGMPEGTGQARFGRMSAACAAALFAVYAGQELLEGALSAGHAGGLDAIFASGGWLSVPLCLLVGMGLALVLRLARAIAHRRAERRADSPEALPAPWMAAGYAVFTPRACELARQLAGRAPPLTV